MRPKSILKKGGLLTQMTYSNYMGRGNVAIKSDLERKGVRFEVRVKIHEFEKYLEDASDNGGD